MPWLRAGRYHLELSLVNRDAVLLNSSPPGELSVPTAVRVIPDDPAVMPLPLVEDGGSAWAVVWPGNGAHLRTFHRFSLLWGGLTHRMAHPMEAVYYVIGGVAVVEGTGLRKHWVLPAGSMVLVHPGTAYRFRALEGGAQLVGGLGAVVQPLDDLGHAHEDLEAEGDVGPQILDVDRGGR